MQVFSRQLNPTELTTLTNNVLALSDTFDSTSLNKLTALSTPKYIVADTWSSVELSDQKIYCLPLWMANQVETFKPDEMPVIADQYAFNFMINKKQINRYLCIKLIEMFELSNYNYTWSGIGRSFDMSNTIKELNSLGDNDPLTESQRSFLLAPIALPDKFLEKNTQTDSNVGIGFAYQVNKWAWRTIFKSFFASSAISLITESVREEKGAVFSEKTAYAILGLNFPIWVGGYNQATEWKNLGFDTFDDIIDHSYERRSTLFERCYYAVADNLKLLQNKQLAHELRKKHLDRLMSNRHLLLNDQLIRACKQIVLTWPEDLQKVMPEIYNNFSKIKHLF